MDLVSLNDLPREKVVAFFKQHWGSSEMVISSGVYDCTTLDGFAVLNGTKQIIGLVTYVIRNHACEIISLDSVEEAKGIGSRLVERVEQVALKNGCERLSLITTNDNLHALKFYQKRGYVLSEILHHAVKKAREIKPEIPQLGHDGIPIREEILIEKRLFCARS